MTSAQQIERIDRDVETLRPVRVSDSMVRSNPFLRQLLSSTHTAIPLGGEQWELRLRPSLALPRLKRLLRVQYPL